MKITWKIIVPVALLAVIGAVLMSLSPAVDNSSKTENSSADRHANPRSAAPKAGKAKNVRAKNETPILVFVILDGDDKSTLMKRYLLNNKVFKQMAQENFATLILKGQKAAKDKKSVEPKSFKNWDFVSKHIMAADTKGLTDTPEMISKYPGAFIVSADGEKKLADIPKYDPELGFGAWAMELSARLEKAGIEICKSPALVKAMENPQPDIKMPAGKGKKK